MSQNRDILSAEQYSNGTAEIKKQILYREIDDTLSEWERSRMTSKTWSMEQD